ncbi:unnamed protein product, partial [marine sediment metagenome]
MGQAKVTTRSQYTYAIKKERLCHELVSKAAHGHQEFRMLGVRFKL